jgi:hypothetical protein
LPTIGARLQERMQGSQKPLQTPKPFAAENPTGSPLPGHPSPPEIFLKT